jgi:multisubunit Na+/H+ antiporter MnhE subunit
MKLLWEENVFGAIGAMIVATVALASAWVVLEGLIDLNGWVAALLSAAVAVGVLEAISRRHYADDGSFAGTRDRSAWSR